MSYRHTDASGTERAIPYIKVLRGVKAGYSSIDIINMTPSSNFGALLCSLYRHCFKYLKTWSLCDLSIWCILNLVTIATKIQVVHSCIEGCSTVLF